jgi:hypothetical protein
MNEFNLNETINTSGDKKLTVRRETRTFRIWFLSKLEIVQQTKQNNMHNNSVRRLNSEKKWEEERRG